MNACLCTLRQFKPIHFFLILFGGGVIKLKISFIPEDNTCVDVCVDVCVDELCFIVEDAACVEKDDCVDALSFIVEDDVCVDSLFFGSLKIRNSISTTNSFL